MSLLPKYLIMLNVYRILFFLLLIPAWLKAQLIPKENSKINYRLICFSFPDSIKANSYTLQIAEDSCSDEISFQKHISVTVSAADNNIIARVAHFGKKYSWRTIAHYGLSESISPIHYFSTMASKYTDSSAFRMNILKHGEQYKDAYVFSDVMKGLFDMEGQLVWNLPDFAMNDNLQVRDLKMSPQGTITFILAETPFSQIYEINYQGDILWKGPNDGKVSGDSIEHYHHEFTRLSSGHYMVLGTELKDIKLPSYGLGDLPGNKLNNSAADSIMYKNLLFGTVIEYDHRGKIIWDWKSSKHLLVTDIFYFKDPLTGRPVPDIHDNAFFFDETNSEIYISYKQISRVLKIKYPEGLISNTFGEIYQQDITARGTDLFCYQHGCKISQMGYLYLFNNNDCKWPKPPTVVMFKENTLEKGALKKIWEYECPIENTFEKNQDNKIMRAGLTLGGNVMELADQSIFISECSPYSQILIVNRKKKLLWKASTEKWNQVSNKWEQMPQYRASIIPDKVSMEKLIKFQERKNLSIE